MTLMCPMLGVSRSKYYAWRQRGRESQRERSDRRFLVLIRSLHQQWDGILGYRRMCTRLRQDHGESIGIRRVRRLMHQAALSGVPKKRRQQRRPGRVDENIPDLLQRDFSATQPNLGTVIIYVYRTISHSSQRGRKMMFQHCYCILLLSFRDPPFGGIKSAFKVNRKLAFEGLPMRHRSTPFGTGFA